ncbi:hypothetical protein ACFOZY_06345 [Chungangia koreensis]|uniref:Uncharacterized protein n=1 Tax=Chungangia koreensis TaxID=752657 RepID=A0ABV8X298_9LACT
MKDLEREYPALKRDRIQRETKTRNRKYLIILIGAALGILVRVLFFF